MTHKYIGSIFRMYSTAPAEFFLDSWQNMILFNNFIFRNNVGEDIYYHKGTVSYHELGRQQAVDNSYGDFLFMLDTDHVFAPDLFYRLYSMKQRYDVPVISGIYQYKNPPHGPVANLWKTTDKNDPGLIPIHDINREKDILQVGSVGGGCLLIDTSVFTRIKKELKQNPFEKIHGLSEDYSFCYRCKQLDIPVYLAPNIECHHVINHVLSIKDYKYQGDYISVEQNNGSFTLI